MIHIDYEWASKKNLDNFQAMVLATIVAGFDTYETIIAFWGKKIDSSLISDTIDFLLDQDWITLDKRNQDVLILSQTGRYHYADNQKKPTRKAGTKVLTQPAVPVLGKVGEVVLHNKARWMVLQATPVKGKVLFDLKNLDSSETLSKVDAGDCLSTVWYADLKEYFQRCISDHGYSKYAKTWAELMTNEWLRYYKTNGWRVGKQKTPMVNWKSCIANVWVDREVNKEYCKFSKPHASDPLHPDNQRRVAYGSIPGVKEVAARFSAE